MKEQFDEWCVVNKLSVQFITPEKFTVQGVEGTFLLIDTTEKEKVFDIGMSLCLTTLEESLAVVSDFAVYKFGQNFYYSKIIVDKLDSSKVWVPVKLTPFRYLGESLETNMTLKTYLGVHGTYEVCNGTGLYKDWCKKAKFLGIESLGICENNTLAGTLSFTEECKKEGIKPIIGESIRVVGEYGDKEFYLKLFVINKKGWRNLLNINAHINVHNDGFIKENELLKRLEGLVVVFSPYSPLSTELVKRLKKHSEHFYYHFEVNEWDSSDRDKTMLEVHHDYLDNYIDSFDAILLSDSYYIEEFYDHVKKIVNHIGGKSSYSSKDQFFKTDSEMFLKFTDIFKDEHFEVLGLELFVNFAENTNNISQLCEFELKTERLFLPKYEMNPDESEMFSSNEELFDVMVEFGLENKILSKGLDEQLYRDRIATEMSVIKKGGFIDYFLILWDVVNWCNKNNIYTGVGRGSAAGCLVSYLLGIVKVDPIQFDLLFERFLNESRIKKGLPDIDMDFEGRERDRVKDYIRQKYGWDYMTAIGTYTTFQLRGALKDVGKFYGLSHESLNYLTSTVNSGGQTDDFDLTSLIEQSQENSVLKEFIQGNPDVIECLPLFLDTPKTASVHAAGVVVVPKEIDGEPVSIYDLMPVKRMNGILVSEWEGNYIEGFGFLKEDILGVNQLDKFNDIMKLIKKDYDLDFSLEDIPLDDSETFKNFQNGYNGDVFQFGARGLSNYLQRVIPVEVEDLNSAIAVYRPGPIEMGSHEKYLKVRFGEEDPEYDFGLESVTKHTAGLYIYQEQVMKVFQTLGGFSLVEADNVRKAMGKMIPELMASYHGMFIEGATKNGCSEEEAQTIWNKLAAFAEYGFNRSHSVAYALTGYYCQWLKTNFPIQFWTVALTFSNDQNLPDFIHEIKSRKSLDVRPPDINYSGVGFTYDLEKNEIYWSLSSIKFAGESVVQKVIEEREQNGPYKSFIDFYERVKPNKRALINFIVCGCFDSLEVIEKEKERMTLIELLFQLRKEKIDELFTSTDSNRNYWWILRSKEVSGFGHINYEPLLRKKSLGVKLATIEQLDDPEIKSDHYCFGGILEQVEERNSKKGKYGILTINHNDKKFIVIMWNEKYFEYKSILRDQKMVIFSGTLMYDQYRRKNLFQLNEKSFFTLI